MDDYLKIRIADENDYALLTEHRRRMFEDLYAAAAKPMPVEYMDKFLNIYPEFIRVNMDNGTLYGWVIEMENRAICSAVLSIMTWPPNLFDQSGKMAYLHSLYTEPEFRRKGAARLMMQTMIEFCRRRKLRTIWLSASDFGRPLYEKLGFVEDRGSMVLYLKD